MKGNPKLWPRVCCLKHKVVWSDKACEKSLHNFDMLYIMNGKTIIVRLWWSAGSRCVWRSLGIKVSGNFGAFRKHRWGRPQANAVSQLSIFSSIGSTNSCCDFLLVVYNTLGLYLKLIIVIKMGLSPAYYLFVSFGSVLFYCNIL